MKIIKKVLPQRSKPLDLSNLWHSSIVTSIISLGDPRPAWATAWQDASTAKKSQNGKSKSQNFLLKEEVVCTLPSM
jgi:hypothetical protein